MTSPKSAVKEKMKYSKTAGSASIGSASSEKGKPISPYSIFMILNSFPRSAGALAAGTGDVAGAIEGTWSDASEQIKQVVDNVVFPVIDLILAVFFFGKLGMAYFDYRKHGQFEWTAPAILFACLVFTLTAPLYIWTILGM